MCLRLACLSTADRSSFECPERPTNGMSGNHDAQDATTNRDTPSKDRSSEPNSSRQFVAVADTQRLVGAAPEAKGSPTPGDAAIRAQSSGPSHDCDGGLPVIAVDVLTCRDEDAPASQSSDMARRCARLPAVGVSPNRP